MTQSEEIQVRSALMAYEVGQIAVAAAQLERICRRSTDSSLHVLRAVLLPPIYDSAAEMSEHRQRLEANLRRLYDESVRLNPTRDLAPSLFYLAYQGHNDRDTQVLYHSLFNAAPMALPVRRRPGRLRVGFLSRYFADHTIGRLMHGVIAGLSRVDFEVVVLAIEPPEDDFVRRFRELADVFYAVPAHLAEARWLVSSLELDVLFYAELGMDPLTLTLAHTRFAPVQCVTWGHPVTSGVPGIDYFISSAQLETADGADEHYSERLVRLKRMGVCYERPLFPIPKSRTDFGLPQDACLYGCLQSLFKFHPDFDLLLGEILRRDPRGLLVLVQPPHSFWQELLLKRWRRTIPDVLTQVHFVPRQRHADFLSLTALCDVMLDPVHASGGNTSYEALAFGVPIVTWPSEFLRGRISAALCRRLGVADCVAGGAQGYVECAVRLGTDRDYRHMIAGKIRDANAVLFDDAAAVRELAEFLRTARAKIAD